MITIYYMDSKYKLAKKYHNDSAYDICARIGSNPIIIPPGKRAKINTGIKITLPLHWEANIRPRSGIAIRHGLTVINTPGTIDQGYTGEISVILINHGEDPFIIKDGDRIAQITFQKIPRYKIQQYLIEPDPTNIEEIDKNKRGTNGFGSSDLQNIIN